MFKVHFRNLLFVVKMEAIGIFWVQTRLKCSRALAFSGRLCRRFAYIVNLYSIWATSFAFNSKKWVSAFSKTYLHLEAQMLRMASAWTTFHTCNVDDGNFLLKPVSFFQGDS
jgi:hypothetical protein